MVWATSSLPRNERLPGVGGGREAMANNAHGVNVHKNCDASDEKKMGGKGSDVELRREFAYNRNGIDLHTGLYVLWLQ
jgi:hypothetical protein